MRDPSRAEDLFQETYLRFINARLPPTMEPAHRKNYLYRIATNLAKDLFTARTMEALPEPDALRSPPEDAGQAMDVRQALGRLTAKQRTLLWLAYVEGFSHEEIAKVARARPASIRPMLARARTKLAGILTRRGYRPDKEEQS